MQSLWYPGRFHQRYGNADILAENYAAMVKWHAFSKQSAAGDKGERALSLGHKIPFYRGLDVPELHDRAGLQRADCDFGSDKRYFSLTFLAHSSALLAEIAEILGNEAEALGYRSYAQSVQRAFEEATTRPKRSSD